MYRDMYPDTLVPYRDIWRYDFSGDTHPQLILLRIRLHTIGYFGILYGEVLFDIN